MDSVIKGAEKKRFSLRLFLFSRSGRRALFAFLHSRSRKTRKNGQKCAFFACFLRFFAFQMAHKSKPNFTRHTKGRGNEKVVDCVEKNAIILCKINKNKKSYFVHKNTRILLNLNYNAN
ncbi:MAG: hypothetical protein IJZ24_01805 [Clostridia bacterium]|nr:hypothetical protein [Clostridia bacterium]